MVVEILKLQQIRSSHLYRMNLNFFPKMFVVPFTVKVAENEHDKKLVYVT